MAMQFDNGPFNEDTFLAREFIRLRDTYNITCVIETGTYRGMTTKWLTENFDYVQTIDVIQDNLTKAVSENLSGKKNLKMYLGSSAEMLTQMIEECPDREHLLIFLDAHWYANPVLDELLQIAASDLRPVLVIHDFKNPNDSTMGYDEYPTQGIVYEWDWIKEYIDAIYAGNCTHFYNTEATGARRGCLFVVPN